MTLKLCIEMKNYCVYKKARKPRKFENRETNICHWRKTKIPYFLAKHKPNTLKEGAWRYPETAETIPHFVSEIEAKGLPFTNWESELQVKLSEKAKCFGITGRFKFKQQEAGVTNSDNSK